VKIVDLVRNAPEGRLIMPSFEVLLHGQGLTLLDDNGQKREGGVYVWRVVTAENETSAVTLARKALLQDPLFLNEIWNDPKDEMVLEAEEIRKTPPGYEGNETSPVFYIEDDV
jgi:hypothetical protein